MAKGTRRTRDPSESLSPSWRSSPTTLRVSTFNPLSFIEDNRTVLPDERVSSPARLFTGATASTTVHIPKKRTGGRSGPRVPYQIAFTAPEETIVCIRRKIRKAVMFAQGKTGKGKRQKKAHWNPYSKVRCK